MSATNSNTASARLPVLPGLLLLVAGAGAGYLTCWYGRVEPTGSEVERLAALLGPGQGGGASAAARLESGIQSLLVERDAERGKARDSEVASELLRSGATAATKEREALLAELQAARESVAKLKADLADCEEAVRMRSESLAKTSQDLATTEQRCAQTVAERDDLARSLQATQPREAPEPSLAPIDRAAVSPSTAARKAQSAEVREALAPLLARGRYQPLRQPTSEPLPFSLRAIEESGALDRSKPESLYSLWSLVTARENDRADRWPSTWAALDTPDWLPRWFEARAADAIPVLDRAQRYLIQFGPTLVELRMLAP